MVGLGLSWNEAECYRLMYSNGGHYVYPGPTGDTF